MSNDIYSVPYPEIFINYTNIKYISRGAYGTIYSASDRENNQYIRYLNYNIVIE